MSDNTQRPHLKISNTNPNGACCASCLQEAGAPVTLMLPLQNVTFCAICWDALICTVNSNEITKVFFCLNEATKLAPGEKPSEF